MGRPIHTKRIGDQKGSAHTQTREMRTASQHGEIMLVEQNRDSYYFHFPFNFEYFMGIDVDPDKIANDSIESTGTILQMGKNEREKCTLKSPPGVVPVCRCRAPARRARNSTCSRYSSPPGCGSARTSARDQPPPARNPCALGRSIVGSMPNCFARPSK